MNRIRLLVRVSGAMAAAFAGASLLALGACSPIHHDFVYTPNEIQKVAASSFKIAVLPFADSRETQESGSHALGWLPIVPYTTETKETRQDPDAVARNEYYFPGLVAYTIALDLAKNGIGRRVDVAPPALEDYDVVIHGKLRSNLEADRTYTYGLGPLSFLSQPVLPQKKREVVIEVTYVVYDARGEVAFELPVRKEWSKVLWQSEKDFPIMHGHVVTVREANGEFVEKLAARLREAPFAPEASAIRLRTRLYHARLDNELPDIVSARNRARSEMPRSVLAEMLDREVRRRARLLESYRRTEDRIISDQQAFVWQRQQELLDETARVRQIERETEARQRQIEREQFHATFRPLAGALVAGVSPAYGAAASSGQWSSANWQRLTQDLSASLAAMPPPPPPPPDLRAMLDEIGIDSGERESPGDLIGQVKGKSVAEVRRNFLRLYATKVRPLQILLADARDQPGGLQRQRQETSTHAGDRARDPAAYQEWSDAP